MMATRDSSRIMLLKEEVRSLSEELVQCQADKEFVWSLWKRLQVANPDLTQAVSLVVEREKWKAEAKDRKVLEILQAKDYKIQELDQLSFLTALGIFNANLSVLDLLSYPKPFSYQSNTTGVEIVLAHLIINA